MAFGLTPFSKLSVELEAASQRLAQCKRVVARLASEAAEWPADATADHSDVVDDAASAMTSAGSVHSALADIELEKRVPLGMAVSQAAGQLLEALVGLGSTKQSPVSTPSAASEAEPRFRQKVLGFAASAGSNLVLFSGHSSVHKLSELGSDTEPSVGASPCACKPSMTVTYVFTPAGMLNTSSTVCSVASVQLAALAGVCSLASVGADVAAASLQTSAEVIAATGDTGAIRRALRDPAYAREAQRALMERRRHKSENKIVERVTGYASLVNTVVVARVSPTASNLAADAGGRLARFMGRASRDVSPDDSVDATVTKHRSSLLQSQRLALSVNSWISTSLASKADTLRASSDCSVESLVALAGRASEYHEQGLCDGSQAAFRDILSPAMAGASTAGLAAGRQVVGTAFSCATHPFSTLESAMNVAS